MKAIRIAMVSTTGGVESWSKIVKESNPYYNWYKRSLVWKVIEEWEEI